MVQETLLEFPAHTFSYRRGGFTTLSTASSRNEQSFRLLFSYGGVK